MSAKVSIIVPVYNQQAYVKQCLQSLCQQTLQDIEIICINDGSTDESLSIIKNFTRADKRFVVINQANQGTGFSRNAGLAIATGEYVGFVDADDFVDADYFEKLYLNAKEKKADICCALCRQEMISDEQYRKVRTPVFLDMEKFKKQLIFTEAHLWSKIFLRQFIQKNQLKNANTKHSQDLAFSIPAVLMANRICWIEDSCYYYRVLHNSASRKAISSQDCEELPQIYNQILANPLTQTQYGWVIERLKNNMRYYLKRISFKNKVRLFCTVMKLFPGLTWSRDYKGAYACAKLLNRIGI